jgi:site-specific recombinase XerD
MAGAAGLTSSARINRLALMRAFARYLAPNAPNTYVPPPANFRCTSTFRPHIYTPREIQALLSEASRLTPVRGLRPHTYVTLFGLLACTGLRVSEALGLRLADVNLEDETLLIRDSKFYKTRLVPFGLDVTHALRTYTEARRRFGHRTDPEAPYFVNEWQRPCSYAMVIETFLTVARRAGLRGAPGQRGPRLHDVRHSFAVHRLLAWYRDGGNVQARLPLLATYLGHVSLVSTQVYLDITAELLHEAAHRFHAPTLPATVGDAS